MKKCKQVLSIFLALLMLVMSVPLAFAEGEPCTHTNTYHVDARQSDYCGSPGNIEYWQCTECGNYFEDEAAKIPLTYDDVYSIPPAHADHDYVDYDLGFEEVSDRIWVSVDVDKDLYYYKQYGMTFLDYLASQGVTVTAKYCNYCGLHITEHHNEPSNHFYTFDSDFNANVPGVTCAHESMWAHAGIEDSSDLLCGEIANWRCYFCDGCGRAFSDEEAQHELTLNDLIVRSPYNQHDILYTMNIGSPDQANPDHKWLSVNVRTDLNYFEDYGMTFLEYQAEQGITYTAELCSQCGVVITEDHGDYTEAFHPNPNSSESWMFRVQDPKASCTHENIWKESGAKDAADVLCGTTESRQHWYCYNCGSAFADQAATQPLKYDQLSLTSPFAAHDFKDYEVGFEDEGNGNAWLSTTSYQEKECQEEYGMTVAEKFASDGYTARFCKNCGVVIQSNDGTEKRPKDVDLFVCPIPELDGAVKLPTSPEGLATGEKWLAIANYLNAVYAFEHPEGEDGFMMLIYALAYLTIDDYYYNEATQELFSVDQYGEVKSVPTVVLRTVGDEENAIALPSSSEGLAVGEKWFDAASFYQDLLAKYESLPDADAHQEMIEAFASQLAAAQIYLSPDGSVVYAKGCNTEIAVYLEDEGAPTDELAAMLNGGNWFIPLNVFFQSEEGDMILNTLDYVKTVEGGACAHVWNDGPVTKNATCTEAGIRTFTCTNGCGATREEIIPALGHDWGEGMVDKKPTITETGVCVYTCNRCKTTKSVTVPKMDPTPLVNELNGQKSLKDIVDDGTVFFEDEANLPADTVFDYEILAQSKYLQVFDLTLTSGGKKVEPEAPVWVKLPIPQGWNPNWISVWHGTEKLPSFAEGGYVYFLTTHFSEFQVKYEEQKPEEPKPDNNDNNDNTNNQPSGKVCKFCGQVHTGFFQKIIGFFHSILALFGLKKK